MKIVKLLRKMCEYSLKEGGLQLVSVTMIKMIFSLFINSWIYWVESRMHNTLLHLTIDNDQIRLNFMEITWVCLIGKFAAENFSYRWVFVMWCDGVGVSPRQPHSACAGNDIRGKVARIGWSCLHQPTISLSRSASVEVQDKETSTSQVKWMSELFLWNKMIINFSTLTFRARLSFCWLANKNTLVCRPDCLYPPDVDCEWCMWCCV